MPTFPTITCDHDVRFDSVSPAIVGDRVDTMPLTADVGRYGAVGNNVADDTAAIQAAIDATSSEGGTVTIPRGIYKISSALRIRNRSNVRIQGDPCRPASVSDLWGSCIRNTGSGYCLEIINDDGQVRSGIWLEGLHLRGSETSSDVIRISRANKVYLRDLYVYGASASGKAGVSFDRAAYIGMQDCRVEGNDVGLRTEYVASGYLNHLSAHQCEFAGNATAGVDLMGQALNFFSTNFEGQPYGAKVSEITNGWQSRGVVFSGCYFEGNTTMAISLGTVSGCNGVAINGCYFALITGTPTRYIRLTSTGAVIEGNSFYGITGDPATNQVYLDNASYVRIAQNHGLTANRITQAGTTANVEIVAPAS